MIKFFPCTIAMGINRAPTKVADYLCDIKIYVIIASISITHNYAIGMHTQSTNTILLIYN